MAAAHVVAAAVVREGRVLAARRRAPSGAWEFPGGKVEPGEAPAAALVRELGEELALEATVLRALGEVRTDRIRLELWLAVPGRAEPVPGADHDAVRWLTPAALDDLGWLPLDRDLLPLVRAVLLDTDGPAG